MLDVEDAALTRPDSVLGVREVWRRCRPVQVEDCGSVEIRVVFYANAHHLFDGGRTALRAEEVPRKPWRAESWGCLRLGASGEIRGNNAAARERLQFRVGILRISSGGS